LAIVICGAATQAAAADSAEEAVTAAEHQWLKCVATQDSLLKM